MSRFEFVRARKMRKDGGFWVRRVTPADLPWLPVFPWKWIAPHETVCGRPFTHWDFIRQGHLVHALD